MNLYTIGFTKKTAEFFFETLKKNHIKRLIDIRLNNKSQLAGFAKVPDLEYFLKISGIEYTYMPEFAPTAELLDSYKAKGISWEGYESKYKEIIKSRDIKLDQNIFDGACLLCSEDKPNQCHRRLAAEYVKEKIQGVNIIHL